MRTYSHMASRNLQSMCHEPYCSNGADDVVYSVCCCNPHANIHLSATLRSHRHDVIRRHTSFAPKDMLRHKLLRASKVMLGKLLQLSTQVVNRYSTPCIAKPLYQDTFPLLKLHVKRQRYKKLTCIPTPYVSSTHHQINVMTLLWAYNVRNYATVGIQYT